MKFFSILLFLSFLNCNTLKAEPSKLNQFLILSGYSTVGGLAAGVVMWPVTGSASSIIYGGIVGATLGVVAGTYHVTHFYHPNNPLRQQPDPKAPWERTSQVKENTPTMWMTFISGNSGIPTLSRHSGRLGSVHFNAKVFSF